MLVHVWEKIPPQHGKNIIIIYDIPKPTIKNPPNVEEKIEKVNMTTKNIDSKISPKQEKKSPNNSKFR